MCNGIKQKIIILYFVMASLYAQPRIQFKTKVFDFGTMEQGETKTKDFIFKNVGNEDLKIRETSCGCIIGKINISNRVVNPRGTGKIKLTFNSKNKTGALSKTIYISTNDPENNKVEIKVKANVKPPTKTAPIRICFFYSNDCEDCHFVEENILVPLIKKYNLKIRSFEISDPKSYEYLTSIEKEYKNENNDIPIIVIGKYILGGLSEIRRWLEPRIAEYKDSGCEFPELREQDTSPLGSSERIEGAYFYDSKCRVCERISYEISFLEKTYSNLDISEYNTENRENKKINEAFCEVFNVPENKRLTTPMLFIGNEHISGEDLNKKPLKEFIYKYKDKGSAIPWTKIFELRDKSEENIKERFKNMGVFTIILAGLVDGINPCAFATIIFLIAFLSTLGKKEEETLLIGITYSVVVFIVYFLIGLGLIKFIGILEITNIIGKVILGIAALLSISFGILSFYDYIKLKRNEVGEVKLQLPRFIKKRIHSIIRDKMSKKNLVLASVVSGFFISLSEFICTGQIYLPTLIFVSRVPELKVKAIIYLILYNIAFIVPLVIVFVSTYKGMRSSAINKFWRNKVKFVKLGTCFFFLFLGLFITYYTFFY
jgi:cytochrome c biogenesis protein CcdA/glutaredoxin